MKTRTASAFLLMFCISLPGMLSLPVSAEERVLEYEVLTDDVELPQVLTEQEVALWVDNGWLRPQDPDAPKAPENRYDCHLVYYYYGNGSYYCDCVDGAGVVDCYCEDSPAPPNQ